MFFDVAAEFGAQRLELDAYLVAWGTDFIHENGEWTNRYASGYREASRVVDARELRMNAYRALLTRGRDASVVFVNPHSV
ncbi:MAG: DNA/RNA helicase domain-containing protein [Geobacteraceae bacterium]